MSTARTRYHHGNLRATLLASAERLLADVGPAELSLRELARQAGVSHGAPRQHFPDKRALLDALAVQGFDRLGTELDTALRGRTGPFADRVEVFAEAWVGFATAHPALLELMFASKNRPAAAELRAVADRAFALPSAMITKAQLDGEITGGDSDRVAMAIFATLQGLAALVTGGMSGDRPVPALVGDTIRTLVDGLRPR
ncbi:MAG TPA: TetR/AcrR family transcriptional regulator [Pseudonocardia sp.]|nr:TetR/AcrR family transcriptional regulator [Pseudonocardia sp.]